MLAKYGKRFHSGMNCNSGRGGNMLTREGEGVGLKQERAQGDKITK